jgi:hypothetical protein
MSDRCGFHGIGYEWELIVAQALRAIFDFDPTEAHPFSNPEERPILICELFHSLTCIFSDRL